ncbi:MAG: hypothetical protein HQK71_03905 [Desulfamplus sp.]|nr:hypothetical protein [Desulfamplus sp.]
MKALFKPIANIFKLKGVDNSPKDADSDALSDQEQQNPIRQMADNEIAKRYCDTFTAVESVQSKLDKLIETKEHIAEDRFASLNEQYKTFIDKHKSGLKRLLDEIDRRIESFIEEKKDAAEKFTEIKKQVQQEAKLLEAGVISKEDYVEKVKSFKPEEREHKERYKSFQDRISLLKSAKNNIYAPISEPSSISDKEGGEVASNSALSQENVAQPVSSVPHVYSDRDVDINIGCGTTLSVKIDGIAIPITASFVGAARYQYLIISHPAPYTTVKPKLFVGNMIYMESLFDGKLFSFSSPIIENLTKPIRAVVLDYPKEVTIKVIRESTKARCRLTATLSFKGLVKDAIISDITPNSCRMEVIYQPTEKSYIAKSDDNVTVSSTFIGDTESHTFVGVIKSVKKKQFTALYGIQFNEISEASKKVISNYISTLEP